MENLDPKIIEFVDEKSKSFDDGILKLIDRSKENQPDMRSSYNKIRRKSWWWSFCGYLNLSKNQ